MQNKNIMKYRRKLIQYCKLSNDHDYDRVKPYINNNTLFELYNFFCTQGCKVYKKKILSTFTQNLIDLIKYSFQYEYVNIGTINKCIILAHRYKRWNEFMDFLEFVRHLDDLKILEPDTPSCSLYGVTRYAITFIDKGELITSLCFRLNNTGNTGNTGNSGNSGNSGNEQHNKNNLDLLFRVYDTPDTLSETSNTLNEKIDDQLICDFAWIVCKKKLYTCLKSVISYDDKCINAKDLLRYSINNSY